MDESRAARKRLADAAQRPRGDDLSDLLRDLEAGPGQVAQADELDDLARRAQAGDQRAREELIERMLPFVNSVARGYRTAGLERADLVQEGCIGILRALRRFDPERGVPFSVYAALWIRQALQELRSDFIRPLRLGIAAERDGRSVKFSLPGPQYLQIEIAGQPLLYLYALPPAQQPPAGRAVKRFEGGKIHDAEQIEDAVAGYFDELDQTREALDRRFDDIESGRVQLIDGDEAMRLLREKSAAARNQS